MMKSIADLAPESHPLRAQLAVVRSLAEEVERHHPAEPIVAELHHQLSEELERLASLAPPSASAEVERAIDVLLVDDDEAALAAGALVLRGLGYQCRVARDADEALAEMARSPAAIVLSDWSMPGKSGLDLCVALKAVPDPPYVILATAFHEKGALLEGLRGGVDDFLRKPIVLEELQLRLLAGTRLIRAKRAITALLTAK